MNNCILNRQKIELKMEMHIIIYVAGTELLVDITLSHHEKTESEQFFKNL